MSRLYRVTGWGLRRLLAAVSGLGALLYVIGLILGGVVQFGSEALRDRWREWLARARGEDVVVDRQTEAPVPVPEGAVEYAGVPMTMERVPIRSENRDAQRQLHAYAERATGRRMTWGQVRKWAKKQQRIGGLD